MQCLKEKEAFLKREEKEALSEKRKYLKLLCSIQKFQKEFLTETEVLMKCRQKPESRLYICTKQATYLQLPEFIVSTHEHKEQYISTQSFLEIGFQTLKAKGSPKVCQLEKTAQDLVQLYLSPRTETQSGQPVLAFNHHQSKKKGVVFYVQTEFFVYAVVPIAS